MTEERLQKLISAAGVCSRRKAEEMMAAGRVSVNGGVVREPGSRADLEKDEIAVDGVRIIRPGSVYLLLNKPAGYITTMSDERGRSTVMDLVDAGPAVRPVGRLDKDTEGVLLLTNDGELANRLTHPSRGVTKMYLAEVDGELTQAERQQLERGVELNDGLTSPASVRLKDVADGRSSVLVTIHEGRKRQVRRMLAAVGHPVLRLVRLAFGPIKASNLKSGAWRHLEPTEIESLRRLVGL